MIQIKQSTATIPLRFLMLSSTDHITPVTGLTPTATLCKNGASSFSAAAGVVSELGGGWYQVAANATDTNTLGSLAAHFTGTGADPYDREYEIIAYDPQSATNLGLSALPTANPAANGGLPTVNASNYVTGVVNNVTAQVAGFTLAASIALSNPRFFYFSGTMTGYTGARTFYPYTGSGQITNNLPTYFDGNANFLWSDASNGGRWTNSTSIGSLGSNYWYSTTLTGTWTGGGSSAGNTPVSTGLGVPSDANWPQTLYTSAGYTKADLQTVLGNVVTVDANNVLNVSSKYWAGATCLLDANNLPKVDVEDIRGTASAGVAGYAGLDWSHVNAPTTTVGLTGTTISTTQVVASVTGAVASVTGNVGGNVTGSVASVVGNVGGNVVGSVASVTANVNTNANSTETTIANNLSTLLAKFTGITYVAKWLSMIMGKTADSGTLAEVNATPAGLHYDNTTMSLEVIDGSSGGGGGDPTAIADAVVAALGNKPVTFINGLNSEGNLLDLTVGDSYTSAFGNALYFDITNRTGVVGTTARLRVADSTFDVATSPTITSGTQRVTFNDLLGTTTSQLEIGDNIPYQIQFVDGSGNVWTVIEGVGKFRGQL